MKLTDLERETFILFNEREPAASIYTYNAKLQAQIAEYARQYPDKIGMTLTDTDGLLRCELPKSDLRILLRKPRSEKQLRASRENARKMRERLVSPKSAKG